MYLVDFDIFNEFIDKKGIANNDVPVCEVTPAIIEYRKEGVLMAKVEVVSFAEFNFLKKNANSKRPILERKKKSKSKSENKYWIRGNEWEIIDNNPVMKLSY